MNDFQLPGDGEHPRLEIVPPAANGGVPTARAGYSSNVLGDAEVHLLDYVKVLYKRRWTAVTAFLVVSVSAIVYTFTTTPMYEAKTQILIEKEDQNVVTFKQAVEQNQGTDDYYQTQYKILQSRLLARRTVDALKLWNNPDFNLPEGGLTIRGVITAPVRLAFAWFAPPKGALAVPTPDETKAQSRTIDRFLAHLTVSPVRNSRLVDVKYESPSPELATSVANALAKNYIEQNLEFKFMASKEASDWLGARLGEQRQQVDASEQALQRYREESDAVSLEERQNIVVQKLADLNSTVTRAKTDRIQKEAAYNQIRAVQNNPAALDTIPAILSNSYIQKQKSDITELQRRQSQLSDNLGPNHPDMRKITAAIQEAEAKLQGETGKIVQGMRNDYQSSLAQEESLMVALEQQKLEALSLNRKGIDYGALQRVATTNRQIFESLLQRTKETGISGELRTNNIRVVDAAELPRAPAYPNRTSNTLFGLFGGALFAVGLVFFFEYMDNRIKTPEEIQAYLGVPFLGMVPALFGLGSESLLISNGVPLNFAESFRAVRTNVLFSWAAEGCRTLVVTSTGPGEGKTLVSSNVALALAQAGQRVLLIDADMRKPSVHDVFSVRRSPGLSDLLVGNAKASEAVRRTTVPGLWLLPAGVNPPNPAELIGSKRYRDFLMTLEQHFDWVIVDTPPVMAVTDSALAANLAHGVLFVVGAEMTSRHSAQRALEQLDRAKAHVVGAVLNRVDLKHHGYYYSHYYRPEYANYGSSSTTS